MFLSFPRKTESIKVAGADLQLIPLSFFLVLPLPFIIPVPWSHKPSDRAFPLFVCFLV